MSPSIRPAALALAVACAVTTGCASLQPQSARPVGLLDVTERPAEKALLAGLRAYDDGQYTQAEKLLQQALQAGLVSPRDRAAAHKHLAFVSCTSNRTADCEAQFRSARAADPAFALSRSEAGHPLWGPVWQRVQSR